MAPQEVTQPVPDLSQLNVTAVIGNSQCDSRCISFILNLTFFPEEKKPSRHFATTLLIGADWWRQTLNQRCREEKKFELLFTQLWCVCQAEEEEAE